MAFQVGAEETVARRSVLRSDGVSMNACSTSISVLGCGGDIEVSLTDVIRIRNRVTLLPESGLLHYRSIVPKAGRPGAGPDVSCKTLKRLIIYQ